MTVFYIPELSCGHCEQVVSKAIREIDAQAKVEFDRPKFSVEIQSELSNTVLQRAIEATGYAVKTPQAPSCCGHCTV